MSLRDSIFVKQKVFYEALNIFIKYYCFIFIIHLVCFTCQYF